MQDARYESTNRQDYEKFSEEIDIISSKAESVYEVSTEIAEKLRDTESTQGVFARCRNTENETTLSSFSPDGKYVVLENRGSGKKIATMP